MLRFAGQEVLGPSFQLGYSYSCLHGIRSFITTSLSSSASSGSETEIATRGSTAWDKVVIPESTSKSIPTTVQHQRHGGDLRSSSGLGMGDGIHEHTKKWLQGDMKTPMQYIAEAEPIKVKGLVVASYGSDDPALGCPVEYITLKGTSYDKPAVCKYTGNRYYSDDWKGGGAH